MKIDFEQMFKFPIIALKINRSHPDIPRDTKWLIQFICMYSIEILGFILMLYNILRSVGIGDFSDACRNGVPGIIFFVISTQYFILIVHQKIITKIFEMMKADFAKDMPEDEKAIVFEYAKKGNTFCRLWLVLVLYTALIFPIQHFIIELKAYIIGEWELIQPYPLSYPSPIEEHKQDILVFFALYNFLLYYVLYAAVVYAGFVPLGPIFMLHACGQLEIVKKRALALYVDNSSTGVEQKLKEIVKHLQYIYGFVQYINDLFNVFYELTFKFTIIILPITVYEVLECYNQGEFSLDFINFIFGAILFSGSPCYYGDFLMEKGEEVRQALYFCGWETRYDHGVRTTLIVMLLRASQPVAIRTMFRIVCLDALTDVFHQAYALFNLMNAAWS